MWAVAVTAAGQRLGTLVLGGRDGLDAGQGRTVERAAMVAALVLAFRLREAETDQRVRTDLLTELLGRIPGPEQTTVDRGLVERGRVLGLRLNTPHVLAVCRCDGRAGAAWHSPRTCWATAGRWSPSTATGSSCCCPAATPRGRDRPGAAGRRPAAWDGHRRSERAARAGPRPRNRLRGGAAHRGRARRTGARGARRVARDLGFAGLVLGDGADVAGYLDRVLGPLLDYDDRRGSDLVGTLAAYFAAGTSPRRAAGALHVHVNTVGQRLDRVTSLLGDDWQAPDRALEIQLALRLHRLRAGRQGSPVPSFGLALCPGRAKRGR